MNNETTALDILAVLQDPILLLREGKVAYCNTAALDLMPELKIGEDCPQPLADAVPMYPNNGVAACTIGAKQYTIICTQSPAGLVMSFREAQAQGSRGSGWTTFFTEQMREHMAALLAAVQQMEGEVREAGESGFDKWLAVMNQSTYRLMRMAGAAELDQAIAEGTAYRPGTLDLAGLCHELEREVSSLARQTGLSFTYESTDASLLTVGDASLLRRMLLGLISNAMKAVGKGGKLGLRLTKRNNRAILTVWDNGPGMDDRSLAGLFQTPAISGIPRPGEGLKLGLILARNIAALHDGVLVVESRQGEGTRFTVSLPIRPPDGLQLRSPKQAYDTQSGFSSLLVELSDALPWEVFLPSELE